MKFTSLQSAPSLSLSHDSDVSKRVLLSALPHVPQLAQALLRPGQVSSAHKHKDMHEIFFVQAGTGKMTVNGETLRLQPGSCVAVEPGETHEIVNDFVVMGKIESCMDGTEGGSNDGALPGYQKGDLVLLYFGVVE